MQLPKLVRGHFVRRDNRFRATVRVNGKEQWAHVANSGRLSDLFTPDRPLWLAPVQSPTRKTAYDLKLVEHGPVLVSVDARLPNVLFLEAVRHGRLPGFQPAQVESEVAYGRSRLDFRFSGPEGVRWVETKSVTLVQEGTALFPDVPTSRGRRHLQDLIWLRQAGQRATVVFVIQRPDACRLAPHEEADPLFAAMVRQAVDADVEVRAFTCRVSLTAISLTDGVPVELPTA